MIYQFHIIKWNEERSEQLERYTMNVRRATQSKALNIVRKKYPTEKGYLIELNNIFMEAIDKIVHKVNAKYGSPLGRRDIGTRPTDKRIFNCYVPMCGAYDKGGAYWGLGQNRLRVSYTKDLSYIHFYRENED